VIEVSNPPEYANTTFSFIFIIPLNYFYYFILNFKLEITSFKISL
ncbi:hypothetical protein Q604_UNBC12457G0001, partial [human gut metagenome]